ncbi:zf-TFIIB domain-containing protein [Thermodesulfobacteriota bacterium]
MDCPVCRDAMITLELDDVEIDHCVGCGGIWLDGGELEMLIGDVQKTMTLFESFRVSDTHPEKPRRCPICDKKMQKVMAGADASDLLIDRCRRNDGLWFDQGELDSILTRARLDEGHKVRQLLADMFGKEGE